LAAQEAKAAVETRRRNTYMNTKYQSCAMVIMVKWKNPQIFVW